MKLKSTIKKSQLESLVTMITKTLLNEIHNVSDKNNLFIEESSPDGSFNVVWRGTNGINDIEQALETLKTYQSNNRLELWSKAHAETSDGYAPMAYRKAGSNQIKISGTLKMLMRNPAPEISEESATSAVAPINGKLPISKRVMENDEDTIPGRFVNRGEVKLEGGINQQLADKIAHYHWDIMQSMGKNERGTFDYKTRGDRYCCTVGLLNGQPAILSVTTEPGRLNLLVGNKEIFGNNTLEEMSDSSGAGSYNIPSAFSRRDGGSSKALDGSKALGYELTPQGKKDFERHPDSMLE